MALSRWGHLFTLWLLLILSGCEAIDEKAAPMPAEPMAQKSSSEDVMKPEVSNPVRIAARAPTERECARAIPIEQRLGQLMFPLVTQLEFPKATELTSLGMLGGVVVLGSPTAAISDAIASFQQRSLLGPGIVAVDEEGGRVQRLSNLTSRVPSAKKVALTLGADQARQLAARHAKAIGELGFTMNLAPVADLNFSNAIGDRSFGGDAHVVSTYAIATAEGILDAGLVPVLKHFPGHGRGSDSHYGLPVIPAVKILREGDLVPFMKASKRKDIPIMVGHLVVEGLTNGQPASLSRAAVEGLLRKRLGFQGLVITDAFNMDAISATLDDAEAAARSLEAGVDLVMLSALEDTTPAINRALAYLANGRLSESSINDSFLRVMHTRKIDVCAIL